MFNLIFLPIIDDLLWHATDLIHVKILIDEVNNWNGAIMQKTNDIQEWLQVIFSADAERVNHVLRGKEHITHKTSHWLLLFVVAILIVKLRH